jgi:hypothetical protein
MRVQYPAPPFNKESRYLSKGRLSEISELFDIIDTLAACVQKPVTFRQLVCSSHGYKSPLKAS